MKEPASFDLEDAEKYSTEWICIKCAFGELLRQACQHIRELKLTVAQLQAELNDAKVIETAMAKALQSVAEKAKRYREALEFYASPEPWSQNAIEGNHGDWGNKARKALGSEDDQNT